MSTELHRFTLPAVSENRTPLVHTPLDGESDGRRPNRTPYHRASQRELVRASLLSEGAFSDYHGDRS
jgi:hypothetical protein